MAKYFVNFQFLESQIYGPFSHVRVVGFVKFDGDALRSGWTIEKVYTTLSSGAEARFKFKLFVALVLFGSFFNIIGYRHDFQYRYIFG